MTPKEKVLGMVPAHPVHRSTGQWLIFSHYTTTIIGVGNTEDEAWEDALRRMENQ